MHLIFSVLCQDASPELLCCLGCKEQPMAALIGLYWTSYLISLTLWSQNNENRNLSEQIDV